MTEQQKVLDANELRAAIQREFFNDSERAIVLHVADENDRLKADLAQARADRDAEAENARLAQDRVQRLVEGAEQHKATIAHLREQAQTISVRLSDAGVSAMPLVEAVSTIIHDRDALRAQLDGFAPYLKDGETPLERLERERADNDIMMGQLAQAKEDVAQLRAALTAAQELLELPGTCVVCSAILEPREDEAPHCHDCVVTDEHEAERQDRITQLEIALAQAAPAQASGL